MATLADVKWWRMCRGIGHVVLWRKGTMHYTACRFLELGGSFTEQEPRRKCRACMAALPRLNVTKETEHA